MKTSTLALLINIGLCIVSLSCQGDNRKVQEHNKVQEPNPERKSARTLPYDAWEIQEVWRNALTTDSAWITIQAYRRKLQDSLLCVYDSTSKGAIYYKIGLVASYEKSSISEFEQYFLSALKYFRLSAYKKGEAACLATLAMINECKGDTGEAKRQLRLAMDMHEQLKLYPELASDYCNFGMIEGNSGNFREAIEYLDEGFKLSTETKYDIGTAFSLCNLSAVFANSGDTKKAKELYDSLQRFRSLSIPFFLYYREQIFSSEMPPLPSFLASVVGISSLKAYEGERQYYDFDLRAYKMHKEDPIIPCGFVEAPYFLQ